MSGTIEIEVAPGELVDKLAILEINHDWPGLTRHRTGATTEGRLGFQRLLAELGLGHVRLVLGVERCRLPRSCRDLSALIAPGREPLSSEATQL